MNEMPERDLSKLVVEGKDEVEYPKIRPIQAIPVSVMGKIMYMIKDQERISHKTLMVGRETLYLLSQFTGEKSIREIQASYNLKFATMMMVKEIEDIIFELDCALMMNNRRFRQYMEFLKMEFRNSDERAPALSGVEYPEKADELKEQFEEFFKDLPGDETDDSKGVPKGIASPHIDFRRGGPVYARAYRRLKSSDSGVFVIFGTSHGAMENIAALTKKTFKTPLGDLPVDIEFLDELSRHSTTDWYKDEFLHRSEHSIEFQTLMLRHVFPEKDIKIIPILTGSMNSMDNSAENSGVNEFLTAFDRALKSTGRKPVFIAGVDFSHVGPHFGDSKPYNQEQLDELTRQDKESIRFLEEGDPDGFFNDVIKTQEKRRICGLSPLYFMARAMKDFKGELMEYKMCSDPEMITNVSIAAISFYDA